jgi:arabinogalactan endo-1,4-beta-galactosidase
VKLKNKLIGLILFSGFFLACQNQPDIQTPVTDPVYDMTGFAKGADISWLTEMEKAGITFSDSTGRKMDCIKLLRNLGMNSIRLRVWVNPSSGWCNAQDVLVKAWRAKQLGMRLLIDFHYSDSWADPSQQTIPAAWKNYSLDEMKTAVSKHTSDVLNLLKSNGITPEWVQVGNETGNGMLWDMGKASTNMAQYAALNNAGYDAVKAVFPNTKVVVHIQEGNNNSLFRWLFDGLKKNGGKWDVIGMSLYPEVVNWQQMTSACVANMKDMVSRYGSDVMICETGMQWDEASTAKAFLTELVKQSKAMADSSCLGIFYWEPQSYGNWKGYKLGAFDDTGTPTEALDAFK